jgi:hypothetical protein
MLADQAKQVHQEMHPDYHYQPRKPSEKKRRIRRNNASASAADDNVESMASPETDISQFDDTDAV